MKKGFYAPALGVLALLAIAACGDDDSSGSDTTAGATTVVATTAAPESTAGSETTAAGSGEYAEVCALAEEMANQETPPSDAQLTQYMALAPEEIADAVNAAAPPIIAVDDDDVVGFFKAIAVDDVETSLTTINTWETANCGIAHDDDTVPEGASREIDASAARVDVRAEDYKLTLPSTVEAGRTSFV